MCDAIDELRLQKLLTLGNTQKIISIWKVSEKILSIPKHCQLARRDLQASESISVISICVH